MHETANTEVIAGLYVFTLYYGRLNRMLGTVANYCRSIFVNIYVLACLHLRIKLFLF